MGLKVKSCSGEGLSRLEQNGMGVIPLLGVSQWNETLQQKGTSVEMQLPNPQPLFLSSAEVQERLLKRAHEGPDWEGSHGDETPGTSHIARET